MSNINATLFAASGLGFILTMTIGGGFVKEANQICDTGEPASCSPTAKPDSAMAEKVFEKRNDKFIQTLKTPSSDEATNFIKDHRPEKAMTYVPCSTSTISGFGMTALTYSYTPVTNQNCAFLGCGANQCLKTWWECNDEGQPKDTAGFIECANPPYRSDIDPIKFTGVFFCFMISVILCVCSCMVGRESQSGKMDIVVP